MAYHHKTKQREISRCAISRCTFEDIAKDQLFLEELAVFLNERFLFLWNEVLHENS